MDEITFNNIIKCQPSLAAMYRVQKQERKKAKNLLIKIRMQEGRALKKLSTNDPKPKKKNIEPSNDKPKKYKCIYYGNLFRIQDII
jgi:hypothetical protein